MVLFFSADHRATDFTYIKIGGIATRFKSHLSMGRLMIGCKCVLPCVVISFHKTFFYHPTLLFMHVYSYLNEKFEYTKCVIRSHKSKRTNNTTATGKRTNNTTARGKGQTIQRLKEKDKQYNG